jgi:hypothetical protein
MPTPAQQNNIPESDIAEGAAKEKAEHGLTDDEARKVAIDHLTENPDYYRKLKEIGLSVDPKVQSIIQDAVTEALLTIFLTHPDK